MNIGPRQLSDLQTLDFLAPGLHLAGASTGGEPRDELIQLRNFLLALRILTFDLRSDLSFRDHHVVVGARVSDDGLVIDVGNVSANPIQKMTVVRDYDEHAFIFVQKTLEPVDGIEIEVVRRLVKQQRLRMSKQSLRQQHAYLLTARQLRHETLVLAVGNIQALQQNRCVAFGGVTIFLADDAFEFAELHTVRVGHFGFCVNHFALFESIPQPSVAHDDGVDHAILVEGKLILAQNSEFARANDRTLLRIEFPGQQLHERRLARPVRPRQAIALSGNKPGRYFVK